MKTVQLITLKKIFATLLVIISTTASLQAQVVPELVFNNPVLESGTALKKNAEYRFKNVSANLDAIVKIKDFSDNNVVISNIDMNSTGWDKAFQPEVGRTGTAPANDNWWAEFEIKFVDAGTMKKRDIQEFYATSLDVDGDSRDLNEHVSVEKVPQLTTSPLSLLNIVTTYTNPSHGNNYTINGPITNFPGIDTSATAVMSTYKFLNTDKITIRVGAKTNLMSTTAAMRMNSIWFKQFNMAPFPALPVKLYSFNAFLLTNKKVELKWVTVTELQTSHFELERSLDGKEFSQIGITFALGNSDTKINYDFTDNLNNVTSAIVYYRLKMVDRDGKFDYSEVRVIKTKIQEEQTINILTYPNPVTTDLRITVPANWQNKQVIYEVYNTNGNLLQRTINANSSQTESMNVQKLTAGMYIVVAKCNGATAQQRIFKN